MEGWDKTMFEIYREPEFNRRYHVIYFTELGEHDRDEKIPEAMMGEHIYDGFLSGWHKDEAKAEISKILGRLNEGESMSRTEIDTVLQPYLEKR